jgi:hypothetical protein
MMCHANNPGRSCAARSLAELPVEQPTKFDIVINLTTPGTIPTAGDAVIE